MGEKLEKRGTQPDPAAGISQMWKKEWENFSSRARFGRSEARSALKR